jgi:glycosyltransferase involved in cell wall biosynthesis
MEYMACGKPAIASYSSGHRDVISDRNSLPLRSLRPISISQNGQPMAVWDDPQLDELIARLDWAYHHRDGLREIGMEAGASMADLTWERTARQFYEVLNGQPVMNGMPSHQHA